MSMSDRHWLKLILNLSGSVIPGIFFEVILITSFSVAITVADAQGLPVAQESLSTLIPELVLGLLLVFRTDTAYGHYWDGSGVISDIVDLSRSLARSIWVYVEAESEAERQEKQENTILVALFLAAVKQHLRGEKLDDSLKQHLTAERATELEQAVNMPVRVTQWLSLYLQKVHQQGKISSQLFSQMNDLINKLTLGMGSCERILTTPLPRPYAIHLKHLLLIYFALLPFKLVGMFHLMTPIAVALLAFALLGIEEVGREIENPFGYDDDDLPLDAQAAELMGDVKDIIGVTATKA